MTYQEKALTIHGDRYDYSQTVWGKSHDKVTIICKKHGPFPIYTHHHMAGSGCGLCRHDKKRAGLEGFIEKAEAKHGEKYDYSKVEYVNAKTHVTIICPEHGEFSQVPEAHTRGQGCVQCSTRKPMTTQRFLEKARQIHGYNYDYSHVQCSRYEDTVTIVCPRHGSFSQTVSHHLEGRGCLGCRDQAMRLTTEEFIKKSQIIHGDLYDYSKVDYKGAFKPVEIICRTHGSFLQMPDSHTNTGSGCPECNKPPFTMDRFLSIATRIHERKYDYSKVQYVDYYTPITIICPIHGEFKQKATNHLMGKGCAKCAGKNKTTEEFLQEARDVHGDKYDYSKTVYTNSTDKVTIICPQHGEFSQSAGSHIYAEAGCPGCKGYTWKNYLADGVEVPALLYFVRFTNDEECFLMVGLTLQTVEDRFWGIRKRYRVESLHTVSSASLQYIYELEQKILADYAEYRYTPKAVFEGASECLRCDPALESRILSRLTSLFPVESVPQ